MTATTLTLTESKFPNALFEANNFVDICGTAAFGASPLTYSTGGVAVSWAIPSNRFSANSGKPVFAQFFSQTPNPVTNLYIYAYNSATAKLLIYTGAAAQTALTELTDGASIPAGVSGDSIFFVARFVRY